MTADHAWVYASSPAAAEEAAKLAADAAGSFHHAANAAAPHVLLIVTDASDQAIALTKSPTELLGEKAGPLVLDESDSKNLTAQQRAAIESALAEIAKCAPIPLVGDSRAAVVDLPPTVLIAPHPVVLLSTRRVIGSATERMMNAAMGATKMNFVARIAAAPMLAWARSLVTDEIVEAGSAAVLQAEIGRATAEGNLSADQIKRLNEAMERRMKQLEEGPPTPPPPQPKPQSEIEPSATVAPARSETGP
jgi:hypothetical protein